MLYLRKQAIVTQQVITQKNNFSHPIWHIFSRIWCISGAKPFIFNIMLQIAYSSRKKTFLNTALFISLQYPVNAIFQLPFKSNSEVLDSPPLFLRTINYVSCWVSVSTRPFSIYFVIASCYGNIKLLKVYFNIHHNDPFRWGCNTEQFLSKIFSSRNHFDWFQFNI